MSANEPDDLAGVFGGGEIADVAAAIKRLNAAFVEFEAAITGVERVRPVSRILGVLAPGLALGAAFPHLPVALRNYYLSGLDQLNSSLAADRLANKVRDDGD